MLRIGRILALAIVPTSVWAGPPGGCVQDTPFTCSPDNDVCTYVVMTSESEKVRGGGGHTCDCSQWVQAPEGKYFKDPPSMSVVSRTSEKNTVCGIRDKQGVTTRKVPVTKTSSVTLTLAKKYLVITHVETGSGAQNEGRTCHIHCQFSAEVLDLPQ